MADGRLEFINEDEELTPAQRAEINRKINKPVSQKPTEPPKKRISIKWLVLIVNAVMFIVSGVCTVLFFNQFYYFNVFEKSALGLGAFFIILPILISLLMFVFWKKFKLLLKYSLCALLVLTVLISVFTLSLFGFASPANSMTSDMANYLVFDPVPGITDSPLISVLFPTLPPIGSSGVTYYYCYSKTVHNEFNVYAEWTLPSKQALLDEVRRIEELDLSVMLKTKKGNYDCIYFKYSDIQSNRTEYEIMMFAYNRETFNVRYAYSIGKGYDQVGQFIPYYETLTW